MAFSEWSILSFFENLHVVFLLWNGRTRCLVMWFLVGINYPLFWFEFDTQTCLNVDLSYSMAMTVVWSVYFGVLLSVVLYVLCYEKMVWFVAFVAMSSLLLYLSFFDLFFVVNEIVFCSDSDIVWYCGYLLWLDIRINSDNHFPPLKVL